MFGIYLHEHGETPKLLKICGKREALDYIDNFTDDFILQKNGMASEKSILHQENASGTPIGFYKTKNHEESMTELKVWKKTRQKGRIYHSYVIQKIFTIDLISISEEVDIFSNDECELDNSQNNPSPDNVRIMLDEVFPELRTE